MQAVSVLNTRERRVKSAAIAASITLLAALHGTSHAATPDNWLTAGGGSWGTPGNWSTNNPPGTTEAAIFGSVVPHGSSFTLDGPRTVHGVSFNVGSAKTVTLDIGTSGSLALLSTDTSSDGASTFYAFQALSGTNTINVPIQLGNGNSGSFAATFYSSVNSSNLVFNGGITESAGQTWGVRIAGNGTGIVNYAGTGKTYSGDTTITAGGILKMNSDNQVPDGTDKGNVVIEGNGQFQLNNTNETINALISTSTTAAVSKSGSNSKTFTLGGNNASGTFAGSITMTGGSSSGMVKTGTGTQVLGGTISVPGGVSTNGGKALYNGQVNAATHTTAVGATSGGTGTVTLSGAMAINGTIAPGSDNTGVLDVATTAGNLNSGSSLAIELGGKTAADGTGNYDQINFTSATGAVNINAASTISVSLVNNFVPAEGDIFYVLTHADAAALAPFAGTTEGGDITLAGGLYKGKITYVANWTGSQAGSALTNGNDVAIYNIVQAPEPTTLALLGLAGFGLLSRRRRCHA